MAVRNHGACENPPAQVAWRFPTAAARRASLNAMETKAIGPHVMRQFKRQLLADDSQMVVGETLPQTRPSCRSRISPWPFKMRSAVLSTMRLDARALEVALVFYRLHGAHQEHPSRDRQGRPRVLRPAVRVGRNSAAHSRRSLVSRHGFCPREAAIGTPSRNYSHASLPGSFIESTPTASMLSV